MIDQNFFNYSKNSPICTLNLLDGNLIKNTCFTKFNHINQLIRLSFKSTAKKIDANIKKVCPFFEVENFKNADLIFESQNFHFKHLQITKTSTPLTSNSLLVQTFLSVISAQLKPRAVRSGSLTRLIPRASNCCPRKKEIHGSQTVHIGDE